MLQSDALNTFLSQASSVSHDATFIRHSPERQAVQADADIGLVYDFDLTPSVSGDAVVATFRSPETVEALRGADRDVLALFQDSGFALIAYESGVPAGYFLPHEHDDRIQLIKTFVDNLNKTQHTSFNWCAFSLQSFLAAVTQTKPLHDTTLIEFPLSVRRARYRRLHSPSSLLKRLCAFVGLTSGVALLTYVFFEVRF